MLGQTTLGVGLTMFLRDQFSGPSSKIRTSAGMIATDFRKMQEEQLRYQRNLNAGMALMGVAAMRGMGRAISKASEFGYEMEFVKSITEATLAQQLKLSNVAKDLAGATMFFPKDVAEGMRFMAMAGMNVPEVLGNITGAVNLAGATMSQLGGKGGAADVMTNIMKQFRIDFKYSTDVADQLSYAVTRSNTNLFDLGEALKYAGSTSMDLNISLQESTAMVMALGNAGMQGSMAGVAMENSMRYMARAFSTFGSGTSKKALDVVGLGFKDVTDQAGNLLTMTEIMKKMGAAIQQNFGAGMNVEKQAVLQAIFGVRGKRAASLLLRNLQEFDRFTGEVSTKSPGHAGTIMSDMMSTLRGEMLKLSSQWQSTWISFTEAVEPFMKIMAKTFRYIGKALMFIFDRPYIGEFLAAGIAGFITIKTVSSAYKMVVAGIRLLHMQAGGSMITMAGQTVAGYASMSAAAKAYGRSAVVSNAAGASAMWGYNPRLFKGTGGYWARNAAGGMKMAKSARSMRGAVSGAWGGLGKGAARGMAFGGAAFVARKGTTAILSKIVGFLGGPVGIALSFVLPGLIGMAVRAIRGNKDETEKNTRALMDQRRQVAMGQVQYIHAIEFLDDFKPRLAALAATSGGGATFTQRQIQSDFQNQLMDNISRLVQNKGMGLNGDLIINIDGDEVLRSPIEKYIENQLYNSGM